MSPCSSSDREVAASPTKRCRSLSGGKDACGSRRCRRLSGRSRTGCVQDGFQGEPIMIEITEVRVSLRNDDKLKAFVSITLNDSFVIRGLKIIHGNTGLFVAMPSRKRPDGQHQDLAHPINDATRKYLTDMVMAEYQRELSNSGAMTPARAGDRDRR